MRYKSVLYFGAGQGPGPRYKFGFVIADLPMCVTYATLFALRIMYTFRF